MNGPTCGTPGGDAILGGSYNIATGDYSAISGGAVNNASGDFSAILGGSDEALSTARDSQAGSTVFTP